MKFFLISLIVAILSALTTYIFFGLERNVEGVVGIGVTLTAVILSIKSYLDWE